MTPACWLERSRLWQPGKPLGQLPEIAVLSVYCDESHDGTTFALAGWVAAPSAWDVIDPLWRAMLVKHNAPAFHACEIVERENISDSRFKHWTFDQEVGIFTDAINILVDNQHWLTSIGCSVSMRTQKPWADSKDGAIWVLLFDHLLRLLLDRFNAMNGISLMFDDKPEVREIVNFSYYQAKTVVDSIRPGMLAEATVGFGSDEHIPPLQAADLFAYEWRKRITDRIRRPEKPKRKSYVRLREKPAELKCWTPEILAAIADQHEATGRSFSDLMSESRWTED